MYSTSIVDSVRNVGGILVLCHKRTTHLSMVLKSLEQSLTIENWDVLLCAQNPSTEVISILEKCKVPNKEIIIRDLPERDYSLKSRINSNLFFGLNHLFLNNSNDFVVVLEDDVVVSSTFLVYMSYFFRIEQGNSFFRGINSVSSYTGNEDKNKFGRYNQGYMWGWGITKSIHNELVKFWKGKEDVHWDYFIEPYARTGYVINPLFSQVKNVGFDETASHTRNSDLSDLISSSFELGSHSEDQEWVETNSDFRLRQDFLPLSNRSKAGRVWIYFIMNISFLIYKFGIKWGSYSHFLSKRIRLILISARDKKSKSDEFQQPD
jgi:hypothetical protein